MSDFNKDIERFFADGRKEVKALFDDLGRRAVEKNVLEGDYNNVTWNLRNSNYYEADEDELVLGNSAEYASEVESRGRNVIDSGVKLIMEELG